MSDGGQRPKDDDREPPMSIVAFELGDGLTDFAPEPEHERPRPAVTQDPASEHLVHAQPTADQRDGLQVRARPPESLDHRDGRRQVTATTLVVWAALLVPLVVAVDLFTGGAAPAGGPPARSAPVPSVLPTAPPAPSRPSAPAPATSSAPPLTPASPPAPPPPATTPAPAPSTASPTVRPVAPTSERAPDAPQWMPSGAPSGDPDASAAIRTPAPAVAPAAKLAAEPTAIPEPVVAPDISREEATSLEVNRIVRGYAESFNALDVGAVAALWLGVDTGELRRVFRSVHSQEMSFRSCDVVSATTSARATCTGSLTYVPKVGSPKPRVQRVRWEFQMQERGGRWLIERLAATPMP